MKNAIYINLEYWFCVYCFSDIFKKEDWEGQELRAVINTDKLFWLFKKYNTTAIFFVLGCIVERIADLIARIEDYGQEIATHGYSHLHITEITPELIDKDIEKALEVTQRYIKKN